MKRLYTAVCLLLALLLATVPARAQASPGITVAVQNAAGVALGTKSDPQAAQLDYPAAYQKGDAVVVSAPGAKYFIVQVDAAVPEAFIYAPGGKITYPIPFDLERKQGYDPKAFSGATQSIKARLATAADLSAYRNVALNALDKRGQTEYFPHALANIVTRNEPQFYERNVIDGNTRNTHHGGWPYESWGTGQRPDPVLKIDFGREVEIDKVRIFIRCDFPHDTYWKSLTISFSDGSKIDAPIEKKAEGQDFAFPKKKVTWVQLDNFQQISTPLGWASLTEIEVYGNDTAKQP